MDFIIQLIVNLAMLTGLIAIVSFSSRKRHFILSLTVINLVIFGLTLVIYGQELSLGSGLGLFAMFTLLRFRSKTLEPMEMSFLLVAICFGVINAIYPTVFDVYHVVILEVLILIILFFMIKLAAASERTIKKRIRYEKLDLLNPEKKDLLFADLEYRFREKVKNVVIESVSFSESMAILVVCLSLHKSSRISDRSGKIIEITAKNQPNSAVELRSSS